jgi:leucyl aminopeptidase
MTNLNKVVGTAKKLINRPYNRFNLDNYLSVLKSHKLNFTFIQTKDNLPIRLMSGNDKHSGIVETRLLESKKKRNIYIIGKGILFDSGGLNLKGRDMSNMSGDKAGMIIALSIANYFKNNVIAFCPVTTNFIQNSQIIPGDEIKIGKKIVKVTNTDAEGRLILAEAITSLNASKNDTIITIATLTGAVGYAIGPEATGVFSDNEELLRKYAEASFEAKEMAWALPLWEYYQKKYYNQKLIKNSIGDIKAGATEGAMFIKQFVPYPENWIHLDCAGSAFDDKGKASGVPLLSLIKFINKL